MKYSAKLSDAVHILSYIHFAGTEKITSGDIAYSLKTNPSYVRQLMSLLKKSEIIINSQGKANPKLVKSPENINLFDVYQAVEGDKPLLHLDADINPECGIGINMRYVLKETYQDIQASINEKMQSITLESIFSEYQERIK
ncbi:Rrf2 family transcriptional regulator [Macrococcus sp. EM39E]|uniref:Rrf2 family transcriptional regulator n=1 Tax=Macrococcus animalis TaxID=3395467 RepID=UPI0039BEB6FB